MLSQFYTISVVLLNNSWNNPRDNIVIKLEVYTSQETRVFAFWFSLIPFFLEFNGLLFFFLCLSHSCNRFIHRHWFLWQKREVNPVLCQKPLGKHLYYAMGCHLSMTKRRETVWTDLLECQWRFCLGRTESQGLCMEEMNDKFTKKIKINYWG